MHYYLLKIIDDVEPCVQGPFKSAARRDYAALRHRRSDPDRRDGLFRAEITRSGTLRVSSYVTWELQESGHEPQGGKQQ